MKLKRFKLTVVARNTIANYAGNLFIALIAFLFIPIYIRYLGIGSYGIIGFFTSLQTFLNFLDLGIGIALNREMSRYYQDSSRFDYLRKLAHSLQMVYWGIGLGIAVILLGSSSVLAKHWFAGNEIPHDSMHTAFIILSLTIVFRWPYSLYVSGIRGMQHQVVLNMYDVFWGLVKSVGSWAVLKFYSPTLDAFLWYQCIITFIQTAGICFLLWYYMPKVPGQAMFVFDKQVLKNISRYAAGMGATALLTSIIMQLDKILVSKLVAPSQFGYYMVATNVAVLVYNASLPIYIAIFPHFSKLAHDNQVDELKKGFHFYSKLLSTLMIPFSAIVFFAAEKVLWLWTNNWVLAHTTAPILQIMIIGTTLNASVTTVQTLLLAYNHVRFLFYSNVIACITMIPLTMLLVHFYGVEGGAISIAVLYGGIFLIQGILIFRKLGMQHLALNWYLRDILQGLLPVAIVVFVGTRYWITLSTTTTKSELLIKFSILALVSYIVSVMSNGILRKRLAAKLFPKYNKAEA